MDVRLTPEQRDLRDAAARLAGDLRPGPWTIAVNGEAVDIRGFGRALTLRQNRLLAARVGVSRSKADFSRTYGALTAPLEPLDDLP